MNISRDNHYVPQMYLNNWATDKKIFEYRLLVSNEKVPYWKETSIRKTGYEKNLYVGVLDNKENDDFELKFNELFETPAAEAIKKASGDGVLTSDDWDKLLDFVAAQYVRVPAFYIHLREAGMKIVPEVLDEVCSKLENITEIPKVESYAEGSSFLPLTIKKTNEKPDSTHTVVEIETVIGKSMWFLFLHNFFTGDNNVREAFHQIKWSIATAPENKSWPTSDNPFVIATIIGKETFITNGFLGNEKVFLFPISPAKILIGSRKRRFRHRFVVEETLFEEIKTLLVKNAFLYVYSDKYDDEIIKMRSRIVNEKEYKRMKKELNDWFSNYKEIEGPMLSEQHIIE